MFYKKNFYVKHLFQLNQSQNNYGRLSLFRKAWRKKMFKIYYSYVME